VDLVQVNLVITIEEADLVVAPVLHSAAAVAVATLAVVAELGLGIQMPTGDTAVAVAVASMLEVKQSPKQP
jgi:hypothetical protein